MNALSRLGAFSWFGYAIPFENRLEMIRGAGFSSSGLWFGPEEEAFRDGRADWMPDALRSKELYLEYTHVSDNGCNALWAESAAERRDMVRAYREPLVYCAKHQIPMVVLHVTASKGGQPSGPHDAGIESFRDLVKYAEDAGVFVAVENTQRPEHLDAIFSVIESPFLGLCYDTSHDFLYSPEPLALLRKWPHLLTATHLADNDGLFDRHWLPGTGIIPWSRVRDAFPVDIYEGSLFLEVFPKDPEAEGIGDFLRNAHESGRWLRDLLQTRAAQSGNG